MKSDKRARVKSIGTSALALFLILFLAFSVQAAVTVNIPTSTETVNGTFNFNATTSITGREIMNFSIFQGVTRICSSRNFSFDQLGFNCTGSTTGLTDGSTVFTYAFYNTSYGVGATQQPVDNSTQTNDLDNTDPVCGLETPSSTSGAFTAQGVGSSDGVDTALTWSISVTSPDGLVCADCNVSEANRAVIRAEFPKSAIRDSGEYTVRLTVTDNAVKATACSNTIKVSGTSLGEKASVVQEGVDTKMAAIVVVLVLLLGAVVGIIWWMMSQK